MNRLRVAAWVLGSVVASSTVACTPAAPSSRTPTDSPPNGTCELFTLENGQDVCLMSEPQGHSVASQLQAAGGVQVEALTDPATSGPVPTRVDLRSQYLDGCLQVRNQGECGWCVGHAAGATLDALYCAEGCPPPRVSMAHLWSVGHGGTIGDCGPGWYVDEGLAAVASNTLVSESTWPYTNGSRGMNSTRPSSAELAMQGRYGATGYTMIADDADKVTNIKRALASGRAVSVWSGVCFSQGWQNGTTVIDTPTGGCVDGYHAYTIVGYDESTGEFLALNSWGTNWGNGGYMRLTAGFVQTEVKGGGYLHQIDRSHGGCEMPDGGVRDAGTPGDGGSADGGGLDGGTGTGSTSLDSRCAAITDCATCTVTSGCVQCGTACVAADATRTGAADGRSCASVAATPDACPAPSGACAAHTDCGTCAADATCAWCGSRGICVGWPGDAASCSSGDRVATRTDQCNDATHACTAATDCASCQALTGCGWCDSPARSIHATGSEPCVGGGTDHSDRTGCDGYWYGTAGMCPMPDAGMGTDDAGATTDAGVTTTPNDAGACSHAQEPCGMTEDCCSGMICEALSCCGPISSACTTSSDCCAGIECVDGTCACRERGQSCTQTTECCGSDVCRGTCQAP